MKLAFPAPSCAGLRFTAAAVLAACLAACNSKNPPQPDPAQGPTSPAASPSPQGARTGDPNQAAGDVWYVISWGGKELGLLEMRLGKPGILTLESEGDKATELRERWQKLGAPEGIAVDMHMPAKDGTGRGAYGSRIFRPSDSDYAMVIKVKLEDADYEVHQVPAFGEKEPPDKIAALKIAHKGGAHVGKLAFGGGKPQLTIETQSVDGKFLTDHWERLAAKDSIKVRYHQPKDGKETLVTLEAKPGDPQYPNAVRLYLMFQHEYEIEVIR